MNRVFPHSDRKGMDAALDMVEATLASLQRRVEKQQKEERGSEREKRVKDAATNTTPPPPPHSITSSKASKKHRKSKSVLIKRKTHYGSKRPRNSSHSSAQRRFGTQIFEMVAEEVPKAHCTQCNRRPGGAKSQDKDANQERRRIEVTRPSHDEHPERERVKWRRSRKSHTRGEESEDNVEGATVREVKQRHIRSRRRREESKEESDPEFPDVGEKARQRHIRSHRREEFEEERYLASLSDREKVIWRHRKRGHSRRRESDNDLDPPPAREKVTLKHRKGHTRKEYSDSDPESPPAREKVIWRHERGHRRRESDSDPEQPPAREKVIWRGRSRKEEPDSDLDSPPAREKVILKHRRGHSRREGPEDSSQGCSYHRSTHKSERQGRAHSDPEVRERVIWRHGKRGHSRHEGSDVTSEDSSFPKATHKSRRPRTLSSRPEHTVQGSLYARPDEALSSRCRYNTQGGLSSDAGRSRGKHERKEAVDVDKQGYAQPTLTSRLRVDQSRPKKKEKENILPYIPCGSKSRSYHVGVIAQQEIGRLLSQPLQEHTHTTHSKARGSSQPGCVAGVTEVVVRQAMTNIHHHLMGRRVHSDPGV